MPHPYHTHRPTHYATRKAQQAQARRRKATLQALPLPLLGVALCLVAVAMAYATLWPVVQHIQHTLALPLR